MKGQSKRFVNHIGKLHDVQIKQKKNTDEEIGFLDLWRYATVCERLVTLLGVVLSWGGSAGLIAAVVVYGELTALFVSRHKAEATASQAVLLGLFNGGRVLPAGNRSQHMDALVQDSVAFGAASVAIMAFQLATSALAVFLANWAADRMITRLRWRLLRAVIRQEIAFFDTNTNMNFATTLTEDMDKLRAGVGEHVVMTSYLAGSVVMGATLSLTYGWQLTLVGLAVIPVALIVAATVSKYQTQCATREAEAYGAASRIVEEALSNIKTVRAFAGEQLEVQLYSSALKPASRAARRRALWAGLGAGLGWTLTYALNAVVLAHGAALCVRDMHLPPDQRRYHVGVMVTVLFCTFMAAQNIAMCQPHLEVLSAARGAAAALFALLERRSRIDALRRAGRRPSAFRGDIQFHDVYFNYPSRPDVKVLRGLNLTVGAGETVALVGASGCGKSTLLQLLQRLYEPHSGSITVDGHALTDLDLHHYRTHIGVVGQEPVLFSGSIRDNIALGVGDDVTHEQIVAAAELAHAHQFITKLADGYDTMLGERGAQLSGGQKQRIAIARAVLRQPCLLLLDEPTSALDPAAERLVQAALDAASHSRTTLIVSHRLSTIVNASRIVYMEHGAVLEQGTHAELLEMKGLYWKLVQEDMTNRSIARNVLAAHTDDDGDDVTEETARPAPVPLARSFSRQSTCRSSLVRSGSRWSAPAPAPLADPALTQLEGDSTEQADDAAPPVSGWALLRLNAAEWPLLAGGGAASFLVGATMPVFALLFSKLYGMFASSSGEVILRESAQYAAWFGAAAALCGAASGAHAWLLGRAGARLTARLRRRVFGCYLRQEQGWLDAPRNSVGALCARLAADTAAVQGATGTRLGTVLQGVSTMAIGVGLALAYSWKMTLVSLLSVPCVIGGIYLEGYVTRKSEQREREALEQASRIATEAVLNIRTVHSLGVEETMLARYGAALAARPAPLPVRGPVYGLCLCAPTLGYAVSLAYGGYLIAREDLPYEHAILVSEALIYGAWMVAEALSFAPCFAAARRAGARVLHALRRAPLIADDEHTCDDPHWQPSGEVEFSSVQFSYPTRPHAPVLRGLQLHLQPRRTVALVGASGCGKSTVMHLLLRNYDPDAGTVSVDGRSTTSLPVRRLRAALGLVQQEPALFSRTLRENIAYGDTSRPLVPLEEVVAAARRANLHQFITSLPMGYDTHLGTGGAALSGGQKQRVAIARALLRDPRVLLLDEATSALDARSEQAVQAALEAASEERTTIIIAHRLATVQHAHTICVIDKGVVAESGSHEELVRRRGLYWELLQQQAPAAAAAD